LLIYWITPNRELEALELKVNPEVLRGLMREMDPKAAEFMIILHNKINKELDYVKNNYPPEVASIVEEVLIKVENKVRDEIEPALQ